MSRRRSPRPLDGKEERIETEKPPLELNAFRLCISYSKRKRDNLSFSQLTSTNVLSQQTPYYWPSQHHTPDNIEYAIYLDKRSQRNRQKHGLEDYELVIFTTLRVLTLAVNLVKPLFAFWL